MTEQRSPEKRKDSQPQLRIFTDGACSGNPGPGGWGAVLIFERAEHPPVRKEISGGAHEATNNRMELTAAIEALKIIKYPCSVDLFTDSQYVCQGISKWINKWQQNGWQTSQKKSVLNADLWKDLYEITQKHDVQWHWVKGHANHAENERADRLANEGMQAYLTLSD